MLLLMGGCLAAAAVATACAVVGRLRRAGSSMPSAAAAAGCVAVMFFVWASALRVLDAWVLPALGARPGSARPWLLRLTASRPRTYDELASLGLAGPPIVLAAVLTVIAAGVTVAVVAAARVRTVEPAPPLSSGRAGAPSTSAKA